MEVTALAEVLAGSRRRDGAVSRADLRAGLSRAGLEELARAVESLWRRQRAAREVGPSADKRPWL